MRHVSYSGVLAKMNPMNWIAPIINFLIDVLYMIIQAVLALFPQSPFTFKEFDWGPFGDLVGAFFPIADMFAHFTAFTTAVLLYYGLRTLLRYLKMIQ